MARGLPDDTLQKEWESLSKGWYSIYQWKRSCNAGHTEAIAKWIKAEIKNIVLVKEGLRQRSFRVGDHRGQFKANTGIQQVTEKRLVRAMFNLSKIPLLGEARDYEVP